MPSLEDTMKCPKCSSTLDDKILGSTIYDRCNKCGGLWFDKDELYQIKKEKDWFDVDTSIENANLKIKKGDSECPRCSKPLHTIKYEHETSIEIDICPKCQGIWLDAGGLQAIHKANETWLEKIKDKTEKELVAVELFFIKIIPFLPR